MTAEPEPESQPESEMAVNILALGGLIAINKPKGVLSTDVVSYVKYALTAMHQHDLKRQNKWARPVWKMPRPEELPKLDLSSAPHPMPASDTPGETDNALKPITDAPADAKINAHGTLKAASGGKGRQKATDHRFNVRSWPFRELKVGHGGTLDPLASVIGVGSGTKNLQHLTGGDACVKVYEASGRFGSATDSYDCTGTVTHIAPTDHVTRDMLEAMIRERFIGDIMQRPPAFSALRVNGQRLYDLARDKTAVLPDIPPRPVKVFGIQLLEFSSSQENAPLFRIKIACGGGTYIRSIIHDIGEAVGSCAHMTELLRVCQGPFCVSGKDGSLSPGSLVDGYSSITETLAIETLEMKDLTDFRAFHDALNHPKKDQLMQYIDSLKAKNEAKKRASLDVGADLEDGKKRRIE